MAGQSLVLACRYYDRTAPLLTGEVRVDGVDVRAVEVPEVAQIFAGMYRGDYDVSEMSLGELAYFASRGLNEYLAVPIFPYRMFRHGFVFKRTGGGIASPEDISGKRVALTRLVVTAGVWMRGMLTDDYGVAPAETEWHYASVHHWQGEGEPDQAHDETRPADGSTTRYLAATGLPAQAAAEQALADGTVDVLCTTRAPLEVVVGDFSRFERVFDDYPRAEVEYFQRTGLFPIMHAVAVRKTALAAHPDLPERLFDAFVRAKDISRRRLAEDGSLSFAWRDAYLERERQVMGPDPWEYGLAPNHHTLERFLTYCDQQGVTSRLLAPEELFAPGTLGFGER
jgi:4,5-dihydroxyphthalate decarboxylase